MISVRLRPPRRAVAAAAVLAATVAVGFGVGIAHAADERLDLADAALEKAAVLLQESQAGVVSPKAQKKFDKAVARAIAGIDDVRAEIAEAKSAVDNP